MKKEIIQGKLKGNIKGFAFLIPDDGRGKDYFIPHSDLKGAMHGDVVLCETTDDSGVRTTAMVLKILERGISELSGTFYTCKSGGFVVPDDNCYYNDIFIPFSKILRAKAGDKVICKILSYPKKKNPEGIITRILGRQYGKDAELKSIYFSYKISEVFPKKALEEAENLEIKSDYVGRQDFTDKLICTIDGEDARDFDDAVSVEKEGENYVLGVHIADVSEYVKMDGAIDNEAQKRATSFYFPEKVFPMLPEKLCNNLCSLVEGEKRLTLSCVIKIDKNGDVLDSEIVPSVIKSSKRFTYTEVQKILNGDKATTEKNKKFLNLIENADKLTDILLAKRDKKGYVDLEIKESEIKVEGSGAITVSKGQRDKAHKIIEEFMILANCVVAETFYYLDIPFVYRVHEKPSEDKLEDFYVFLEGLGLKYKRRKNEIFSEDFQKILKDNQGKDYYSLINRVMLRSMQKAKYSSKETGHFGLSEKFYCHFTSPIRRYPDLTVHRIIKDFYKNGIEFCVKKYSGIVEDVSIISSMQERVAQDAERTVDDFYKMLYLSNYIGMEFDAIISGVTNFGLFAEIDCGIEGLIKIETLKGKNYVCDAKNYVLTNGIRKYKLGQKVKIKVANVDYSTKKADYLLV